MQSPEINELAAALAAAQGEMANAPLNKVNPHFKSRYADLAAVRDATIPALSKHGLAIVQMPDGDGYLTTTLLHASGQWLMCNYPLPMSGRPHEIGSAMTYARRYSWQAMCGISADEDDDANAAQEAPKIASRQPAKRTQVEISGQKTAKENIHAEFEDDLRDVNSLVALALFEDAWAGRLKGSGGHVWTMQEKLEAKRLELSVPADDEPDADGVLPEPEPTTRPDYVRWCHDRIATMTDEAVMRTWWAAEAMRRRRFSLDQTQVDGLKSRMDDRRRELSLPPGVAAAGHMIAGAG